MMVQNVGMVSHFGVFKKPACVQATALLQAVGNIARLISRVLH